MIGAGKLFQPEPGEVDAVGVAVEGRIEVGAGVGDHLDLADVELGAGCVSLARGLAGEVIADDRRGQAFVGNETVFDGMAEIDEHG